MNKVLLIGRLGRDPEQHWTANGAQVVTMSVATTESYTDRAGNRVEQTEWHRVVTFQRTASICAQYLTKGRLVYVEGKIQTRKWQDQQGQERTVTEIRAEVVRFLDTAGGRAATAVVPNENLVPSSAEGTAAASTSWRAAPSDMDEVPF